MWAKYLARSLPAYDTEDIWVCRCADHAYLHGRIRKHWTLVEPGGPKGCGCGVICKSARAGLILALVPSKSGKKVPRMVNPVTYQKMHGQPPEPYQKKPDPPKKPRQKKIDPPSHPRSPKKPDPAKQGGKQPQQAQQKPAGKPQPIRTLREEHITWADASHIDADMHKHMYEHQLKGASQMAKSIEDRGWGLLGDGTGVGKSTQILAMAHTYAKQGKKVLIVAPTGVIKPKWKTGEITSSLAKDAERMGVKISLNRNSDLKAGETHVTTYDQLAAIAGKVDKDTIVLFDEIQSMKTSANMLGVASEADVAKLAKSTSKRAKAGAVAQLRAGGVLYASATPYDTPLEMAFLLRAHGDIFNGQSRDQFIASLGIKKTGNSRRLDTSTTEVAENLDRLFIRLTKKGAFVAREVSLDGVDVTAKGITLDDKASAHMRTIDNHYGKKNRGISLMQQRMFSEQFKVPHIVDEVKQAIADGYQPVVFIATPNGAQIKDDKGNVVLEREGTAKLLTDALAAEGITDLAHLHGGASRARKGMKAFQDGSARVAIATPQSGGTGIDLDRKTLTDKPRRIIMATTPFSATDTIQIFGRINRLMTAQDDKRTEIRFLYADTEVDKWNAQIALSKVRNVGATTGGKIKKLKTPEIEDLTNTPEKILKSLVGWAIKKSVAANAAAHRVDKNPTESQRKSGNYRKGHFRWHGLDISIENARGATRSGIGRDGKRWSVRMPAHYGYVKQTEGRDGDHVDVYIGQAHKSDRVFIIDQVDAESKRFDEHKCLIDFADRKSAISTYARGFSDGKGRSRIGGVTEMSVAEFVEWVRNGDATQRLSKSVLGMSTMSAADGGAAVVPRKAKRMKAGTFYDIPVDAHDGTYEGTWTGKIVMFRERGIGRIAHLPHGEKGLIPVVIEVENGFATITRKTTS